MFNIKSPEVITADEKIKFDISCELSGNVMAYFLWKKEITKIENVM